MKIPWRRVAGVVLVLAAGTTVVQSARTTADLRRFVECQAQINNGLIARSRILTEAGDQERDAERAADEAQRLVFTDPAILKPVRERTPAEQARILERARAYQDALNRQNAERTEADKARAEHPVPPPPSAVCG